ncbi:hypothetical protein JMJ77_0005790, partial [Colletotrichum scovillei]
MRDAGTAAELYGRSSHQVGATRSLKKVSRRVGNFAGRNRVRSLLRRSPMGTRDRLLTV